MTKTCVITVLVVFLTTSVLMADPVPAGDQSPAKSLLLTFVGAWVGLFQWRVLKEHFTGAAWWVLASCLAWGLGALIMVHLALVLVSPLVLASITAIALNRLLQDQRKSNVPAAS